MSKIENLELIKGMKDIYSEELCEYNTLEAMARNLFSRYGYGEIKTPLVERESLFARSIGEVSDILQKQMYKLEARDEDDKKNPLVLRPEGTAPVVRAYLQSGLANQDNLCKFFYTGAMFRGEKPQAGRSRQFHQIGIEVIGTDSKYADIEVINLLWNLALSLGLTNCFVKINNIGCKNDRLKIEEFIKEKASVFASGLCQDCQRRLKTSPLRVLDCKNENCISIIKQKIGQKIPELLCDECSQRFKEIKGNLEVLGVNYKEDNLLVRGLDYYTHTIFELVHTGLGSQNAIAAGGRYDELVEKFGGHHKGCCGFALGVERTLLALEKENKKLTAVDFKKKEVFVLASASVFYDKAFNIAMNLRKNEINAQIILDEKKSLKAQMRQADKKKAAFVVILGEEESKNEEVLLKDMASGKEQRVAYNAITKELKKLIKE